MCWAAITISTVACCACRQTSRGSRASSPNLPLTVLLHTFFQHFVAVQNLRLEEFLIYKTKTATQIKAEFKPMWKKIRVQRGKDYVLFPLLAGPLAPLVLVGNIAANLARNVWACAVIFNGHFLEQVEQFPESVIKNETRGQWYVRQLLGSANFSGGRLLHVMSGNPGFQIEHHLFPDMPAHRYAEIAPQVRAICEQHGLLYHTGSFFHQTLGTWKRIARVCRCRRGNVVLPRLNSRYGPSR